jgi:biopolymer transport protein ExbB
MKMEPWKSHLRHARRFRSPWSATAAVPGATALIAWLAEPSAALAQDNVVATATLPRDLSPWGMFLNADPVVKAVLVGLAFASLVTWTVWLAKSIEIFFAKRRVRAAAKELAGIYSLDKVQQLSQIQGEVAQFLAATATELKLSPELADNDGIKERIASRLERIEANCGRRMLRGTGVLATIGATAPFVGLFGTVWGIMNSFIGTRWSRRGWPRRCSRRRSGSRPRYRLWSSTTCSRARSQAIVPGWGTQRRRCCGWSAAISNAPPPSPLNGHRASRSSPVA